MPLTIISHITQYISYLRQFGEPLTHESIIKGVAVGGGIQGFCIGLLSALAVASAKTEDDVGYFAAIAFRLAFCIGAYVDFDQRQGGNAKASTLALRWKASTTLEDIELLLSRYPDVSLLFISFADIYFRLFLASRDAECYINYCWISIKSRARS